MKSKSLQNTYKGLKRVCIIAPCLTMGGMERASSTLANALAKQGLEVHFVVILKKEHFFKLEKNIHFHEPEDFNINRISIVKTLLWLRKILIKIAPDSTLTYGKFYGAISVLAGWGTGLKIFVSERSSPLLQWPLIMRLFNRVAFTLVGPAGIIAQTNIAADYQRKYYGQDVPIEVIPNALRKISCYPEIKREQVVLGIGRFSEHLKGIDRLMEAFALADATNWRLVLAGGEANDPEIQAQAQALGIASRVACLGKVHDIDRLMASASIFVLPSRSEGFPNALCEAMAAGLACVSFDFVAGPRDIITHGQDGILVPNDDIPKLAQSIRQLAQDAPLRAQLGTEAQSIQQRLDADSLLQKYINFLLK